MLNIIERLDRNRFAPAVCVGRKGGSLDAEVERLGIPFLEAPFTLPSRPYSTLLYRAWKAAAIFRPYRFKIWHSFHYSDDYTEPIVARLAGCRHWIFTKKNMNWRRRSWYLRSLLASRIAAQNTDMVRDFFGIWPLRGKTRLVPRGVRTDRFTPDLDRSLGLRSRFSLSPETVTAGCVAQLLPVKGHPTLLRALALVPGIHLFIAGKPLDKEYTAQLEQIVTEKQIGDRVHFLGEVRDVPALLQEMAIFVLPTWAQWRMEGCPVALLEAMSCGRACIATDIPGSRDLVQPDISGLLVPPEEVAPLAAALQRLADNAELRDRLGHNARERVLASYTIERETQAHQNLYEELL